MWPRVWNRTLLLVSCHRQNVNKREQIRWAAWVFADKIQTASETIASDASGSIVWSTCHWLDAKCAATWGSIVLVMLGLSGARPSSLPIQTHTRQLWRKSHWWRKARLKASEFVQFIKPRLFRWAGNNHYLQLEVSVLCVFPRDHMHMMRYQITNVAPEKLTFVISFNCRWSSALSTTWSTLQVEDSCSLPRKSAGKPLR